MNACATKTTTLLIGWGSDLRGDDAVGRAIAERFRGVQSEGLSVLATHQLLPELAPEIAAHQRVIFVDAYAARNEGAGVFVKEVEPAPAAEAAPGATVHSGTPEQMLELARDLYGATPEAWLVGVPAHDFELGAPMTEATRQAADIAITRIGELCPSPLSLTTHLKGAIS